MSSLPKLWILFPTRDEASAAFGFNKGNWKKLGDIDYFIFQNGVVEITSFVIGVGDRCSVSVRSIVESSQLTPLPKYAILAGYAGACLGIHKTAALFWVRSVFDDKLELKVQKRCPALEGGFESIQPANVICSNQIATSEKKRLFGEKGMDLVEMEYLPVERELTKKGVDFISIRVVLDELGDEIPESLGAILQNGRVNIKKMVFWAICNAWLLPKVIRLGIQARKAKKSLENGLNIMISRLF